MKRKFHLWGIVVVIMISMMTVFSMSALAAETNNSISTQVTNTSTSGDKASVIILADIDSLGKCWSRCDVIQAQCNRSCGSDTQCRKDCYAENQACRNGCD